MSLAYSYIVLGAGKQGVAAAYDLLLYGKASRLTLVDNSPLLAEMGVRQLKSLLDPLIKKKKIQIFRAAVDGRSKSSLKSAVRGHHVVLSALPYYLNPGAAAAAIEVKTHYADLGGHFDTTREIQKLDGKARKAGVILTPDCGVSPGMCNSLAAAGIDQMDRVDDVHMYCGGLPQKPRPPLDYKLVFNLEGVLGNYFGKAYVLKNGKVSLVPSFSDKETLDMGAPLGKLEAVVTGGATSTCPWTYKGKIKNYDYKTLRYPGHFDKIAAMKELGLFDTQSVKVKNQSVIPRDVFVAVAEPRLRFPDDRDLLAMRVIVRGAKGGRGLEIVYDVLEFFDEETGFTAMQRTTGFSAAVVAALMAQNRVPGKGFIPVEKAVNGRTFIDEIGRRGVHVRETLRPL